MCRQRAMHGSESEASTFPRGFGSKERLKNSIERRLWHPATVVSNLDFHIVARFEILLVLLLKKPGQVVPVRVPTRSGVKIGLTPVAFWLNSSPTSDPLLCSCLYCAAPGARVRLVLTVR